MSANSSPLMDYINELHMIDAGNNNNDNNNNNTQNDAQPEDQSSDINNKLKQKLDEIKVIQEKQLELLKQNDYLLTISINKVNDLEKQTQKLSYNLENVKFMTVMSMAAMFSMFVCYSVTVIKNLRSN